jgi:hypothetical protein
VLDVEGRAHSRLIVEDRATGPHQIVWSGLDEGEAILRRIGNRLNLAMLLCHRAEREWADGDGGWAQAALKEAETLAAEIGLGPDSELRLLVGKLKGAFGVGV